MAATFEGAVVREQGVSFAIIVVKNHVLDSESFRQEAVRAFQPHFRGLPLVLMAQDGFGDARYWGRPDIVRFLSGVPLEDIPSRRYTIS